jgi:hypothetical protein
MYKFREVPNNKLAQWFKDNISKNLYALDKDGDLEIFYSIERNGEVLVRGLAETYGLNAFVLVFRSYSFYEVVNCKFYSSLNNKMFV